MTESPFQNPPQPGRWVAEQWIGHLLLCEPERYIEEILTQNGPADAIEGTITVLTAPNGPEEIIGARVFQGHLIAALRVAIGGKPVIGRLGQRPPAPGRKFGPYVLTDATPEDFQYAAQYWQARQARRQAETFAQPSQPQAQQQYDTQMLQQQGYPTPQPNPAPAAPQQPVQPPAPDLGHVPLPQPQPQPQPGAQGPAPVQELTPEMLANLPSELVAQLQAQQGGQQ